MGIDWGQATRISSKVGKEVQTGAQIDVDNFSDASQSAHPHLD
jgi:hypothetical protein